jgi:hypothetical protein
LEAYLNLGAIYLHGQGYLAVDVACWQGLFSMSSAVKCGLLCMTVACSLWAVDCVLVYGVAPVSTAVLIAPMIMLLLSPLSVCSGLGVAPDATAAYRNHKHSGVLLMLTLQMWLLLACVQDWALHQMLLLPTATTRRHTT